MFNRYLEIDEWKIIEKGFDPARQEMSESIFSIGNGRMGQRANFEEAYSGETLQGNYVAGVYYPDKTKVGWWKNGYPEYFAKVLNACNWIGINIEVDGVELDLAKLPTEDFVRMLDMQKGTLHRSFVVNLDASKKLKVEATRFVSLVNDEVGLIKYSVTPLNFSGTIKCTPYLDFDVTNADANWDDKFWEPIAANAEEGTAYVQSRTKKTAFEVGVAMRYDWSTGAIDELLNTDSSTKEAYAENSFEASIKEGETSTLYKYVAVLSSMNHPAADLEKNANVVVEMTQQKGFEPMLEEHIEAWAKRWETSDIIVEGDASAQQGIRFNIFQLNQTFTGVDERLNIGPKGFTGEKYGGSTYWDTEAYCLPFYLATADPEIAKNLLYYRYKHLPKAIENAEKLGFTDGAALYPMVTMNGEECHNEWEITFE
ncbi:MAG: glycoside hydrolase family 65 protein, partial [Schleiferiaceae bacterium]|nr:glycoside hydrolase family 65 protein [Schleiferiaceae bacterium]